MRIGLESASPKAPIFAVLSLLEGAFPKAPILGVSGDISTLAKPKVSKL